MDRLRRVGVSELDVLEYMDKNKTPSLVQEKKTDLTGPLKDVDKSIIDGIAELSDSEEISAKDRAFGNGKKIGLVR